MFETQLKPYYTKLSTQLLLQYGREKATLDNVQFNIFLNTYQMMVATCKAIGEFKFANELLKKFYEACKFSLPKREVVNA